MTDKERDEAVASLNDKLAKLEADGSLDKDASAWLTFTGLPASMMAVILRWAEAEKVSVSRLLTVVAAIAFQHGRDHAQATDIAKAASDSVS